MAKEVEQRMTERFYLKKSELLDVCNLDDKKSTPTNVYEELKKISILSAELYNSVLDVLKKGYEKRFDEIKEFVPFFTDVDTYPYVDDSNKSIEVEEGKKIYFAGIFSDVIGYDRYLTRHTYQRLVKRTCEMVKGFVENVKDWDEEEQKIKETQKGKHKYKRPNFPNFYEKGEGCPFDFDGAFKEKLIDKKSNKRGFSLQTRKLGRTEIIIPYKLKTPVKDILFIQFKVEKEYVEGRVFAKKKTPKIDFDYSKSLAIDLGINRALAICSNDCSVSILVNGKEMKSYNAYANNQLSYLMSKIMKEREQNSDYTTKAIDRIFFKKKKYSEDFAHKLSKIVLNIMIENKIGTCFVGNLTNSKHKLKQKKKEQYKKENKIYSTKEQKNDSKFNRMFTQFPFGSIIKKLRYKIEDAGGYFIEIHEGYSSLCSAVDEEEIKYHDTYMGVRGNNKSEIEIRKKNNTFNTSHVSRKGKLIDNEEAGRGLFFTKDQRYIINSDINGAANILRKGIELVKTGKIHNEKWVNIDKLSDFKISKNIFNPILINNLNEQLSK